MSDGKSTVISTRISNLNDLENDIPPIPNNKHTVVHDVSTGEDIAEDNRKITGYFTSYSRTETGESWIIRQGRNVIGSNRGKCTIYLGEDRVTEIHANLTVRRSGKDNRLMFVLTDASSTNGTFVNEEDIEYTPKELQHGDIVKIGGYELLIFVIDTEKLNLKVNENFKAKDAIGSEDEGYDYSVRNPNSTRIQ